MAWEKTHKIVVKDIDKSKIWRTWENVNDWHTWDSDIECAKLDEPFTAGSCFLLKPKGGPRVRIRLIKVQPESAFTDVTSFPLAKMFGVHQMRDTEDGLEITHTVRIEGPLSFLWRKIVAEKVAAGIEEQATRMLERARQIK